MTKKYLIVLQGQGDTDIILANAEAKEWVESPPQGGSSSWDEMIPTAVQAGHEPDEDTNEDGEWVIVDSVNMTIGSFGNDRAMCCPGDRFDSLKEVMSFCKKNKIEIIGEFHGFIY